MERFQITKIERYGNSYILSGFFIENNNLYVFTFKNDKSKEKIHISKIEVGNTLNDPNDISLQPSHFLNSKIIEKCLSYLNITKTDNVIEEEKEIIEIEQKKPELEKISLIVEPKKSTIKYKNSLEILDTLNIKQIGIRKNALIRVQDNQIFCFEIESIDDLLTMNFDSPTFINYVVEDSTHITNIAYVTNKNALEVRRLVLGQEKVDLFTGINFFDFYEFISSKNKSTFFRDLKKYKNKDSIVYKNNVLKLSNPDKFKHIGLQRKKDLYTVFVEKYKTSNRLEENLLDKNYILSKEIVKDKKYVSDTIISKKLDDDYIVNVKYRTRKQVLEVSSYKDAKPFRKKSSILYKTLYYQVPIETFYELIYSDDITEYYNHYIVGEYNMEEVVLTNRHFPNVLDNELDFDYVLTLDCTLDLYSHYSNSLIRYNFNEKDSNIKNIYYYQDKLEVTYTDNFVYIFNDFSNIIELLLSENKTKFVKHNILNKYSKQLVTNYNKENLFNKFASEE